MDNNNYTVEERAENENVLGARWHEDPMEWELADEEEDETAPSDYGEDHDSDSESEREVVDSDDEFNDEMADISSNDDFPPANQSPPRPPPNESSGREVTVQLFEETDNGHTVYVQEYPVPTAGQPVRPATKKEMNQGRYPDVGKLSDHQTFEIIQLLMASGMSAGYRNKFFRLRRLRDRMPYDSNRAMIIDVDKLPHGAGWTVQALAIEGDRGVEIVELWLRDAFEIIKQLLRNKRLGRFMRFTPTKKWTSPDMTDQIRDDIDTADWMWKMQGEIEDEFGTIIPVIISSDETKLTNFSGDKKAHPVYITIGNLPKRLRRRTSKRANVLLGYLPVPKLNCESNKEERRIQRRHLFHQCMRALLKPLAEAAKTGVEVPCADGGVRRIYPLLASYIADFPEQCKVACIKQTHCPLCTAHPRKKGDLAEWPPRTHDDVTEALDAHRVRGNAKFERMGLFDVDPFWRGYPHIRVDCLLTPDLLHHTQGRDERSSHQMGNRDLEEANYGRATFDDAGILWNAPFQEWHYKLSDRNKRVVTAARALLDFMYLAHSSSLTDSELDSMERCLRTFHQNKSVFRPLGALQTREAFHGIPKMIQHYGLIRMLGVESSKCNQADGNVHSASRGFGDAREYLDEIGSIADRAQILAVVHEANAEELENDDVWEDEEEEEEDIDDLNDVKIRTELAGPERWHSHPELVVAKTPTDARIKLDSQGTQRRAPALARAHKYLKATQPAFKEQIPTLITSETKVQSWSRARLFHSPPPFKPSEGPHIDVIRAQPTKFDRFDRVSRPARFDTVSS
ncbi:plasma membrane ATPase 4 [Ceratobasidium sp. AG-Ba]|nr:plasma membrane ATPase 4 [Ceratobasidium sp. AG-Ba]